jgi:hypothetical protein
VIELALDQRTNKRERPKPEGALVLLWPVVFNCVSQATHLSLAQIGWPSSDWFGQKRILTPRSEASHPVENRSNIQTVGGSDSFNRLTVSNRLKGLLARHLLNSVIMLTAIGVSLALHPLIIAFAVFNFKKASSSSQPAHSGLFANAAPIQIKAICA